jgi:hypothetical protein
MTEYILVIAILFSLVVLGGLISIGNERQGKAIDKISEYAQAWAIEDLRLKRGQIRGSISIDDPIVWLSTAASRALGRQVQLNLFEVLENPTVLSCVDQTSGETVFFSILSPKEFRTLSKEKRSKLSKRGTQHPLVPCPKGMVATEMNVLNAGFRFDIELASAWQKLSRNSTISKYLWAYI